MKEVSFLWALFLVAGPRYDVLAYILGKVRGIVTDGGVESHTLGIPSTLQALLAWNRGRALRDCSAYLGASARLFPNALRITGWLHSFANLMSDICEVVNRWPRRLQQIQSLDALWKNATWRQYMKKATARTGGVDESLFRSFT